jgi:hypothetical protein
VGFLPTEPDAIVGDLLLKKTQQMKQQQCTNALNDETVLPADAIRL